MAILFDLDGVFYQGDKAIPHAASVAAWARDENIPHLFLTNTTSRPRTALLEKLAGFGIHTDIDHILTPPVAAVNWCRQNIGDRPVALFVPQQTRVEFDELSVDEEGNEVGAIIVGDLGEQWTFDVLNRAFRLLMQPSGPQLIALGMTRYWQAADGLRLDVAPFVQALSYASGATPVVLGKPAVDFYRTAIAMLETQASQIVMVGDDIRGDVEGAQKAGLRGVLVRTGKFRDSDLSLGIQPDAVLSSVVELPDWYRSNVQ